MVQTAIHFTALQEVLMPANEYNGHADTSASKAAADENVVVAAADRPGYDPAEFADQPGAAARSKGYPRHDGSSTAIGGPRR